MPAPPDISVGALSRIAPCDRCLHDEHLFRCGVEVADGVFCPCRDVPVNGAI
jgi:hypothetical protein